MPIALRARLGFNRAFAGVLAAPVFIDRVADFIEDEKFARQFQNLRRAETFHGIGRRVAQRFEQSGAHQHRNIMLGQPQHYRRLRHVQHGGQSPQVQQFHCRRGNQSRLAIRFGGQHFIDLVIHGFCSLKVMVTEVTIVVGLVGGRSPRLAQQVPR